MRTLILFFTFSLCFSTVYTQNVSFKLRNTGLKSIPLEIPGVMNPKLSPLTWSGLSLKIGQKIYFLNKGNREILLKIDRSLEGKKLNIKKLIKKRKKELAKKGS